MPRLSDQPFGVCIVEPIGRYDLDSSGQQLNRCGQVLRHHHRLEPRASSVREAGVREFPSSNPLCDVVPGRARIR